MNLRNFNPYLAVTITSYAITFGLYIYYSLQYDKKRGVMPKYEKLIYTMSMISLICIPYFGCMYSIVENNLTDNHSQFIIINTILIVFFIIVILIKDTIIDNIHYNSVKLTFGEDWIDKRKYNKQGILVKGEKELTLEELRIKENAGESEYFERKDMEEGINE